MAKGPVFNQKSVEGLDYSMASELAGAWTFVQEVVQGGFKGVSGPLQSFGSMFSLIPQSLGCVVPSSCSQGISHTFQ